MFFSPCEIVYISVHSFTNVWFGGGTEYSLALTETDDISTGMFMVYGSQGDRNIGIICQELEMIYKEIGFRKNL